MSTKKKYGHILVTENPEDVKYCDYIQLAKIFMTATRYCHFRLLDFRENNS